MNAAKPERLPAHPLALPNILTYARIAAVPVVVGLMYWQSILDGGLWLRWVALAIFIAAGVTDILDGYFARMGPSSSLRTHARSDCRQIAGGILPLDAGGRRNHPRLTLLAAVIILCRRFWCRACANFSPDLHVSIPVTQLAKWKTMVNWSRSAS